MKRTASALVEYPGSGDEGTQDEADERSKNFQLPKRRCVRMYNHVLNDVQ